MALKDRECSTTHRASVNTPCGERYGGLRDFRRSRKPCRHTVVIPLATSATMVHVEGGEKRENKKVRSALGGVKEWEKGAEEGRFDCEAVVCVTRHSAKVTSQATRGVLRQLLSLAIALSLGDRQVLSEYPSEDYSTMRSIRYPRIVLHRSWDTSVFLHTTIFFHHNTIPPYGWDRLPVPNLHPIGPGVRAGHHKTNDRSLRSMFNLAESESSRHLGDCILTTAVSDRALIPSVHSQ
jgi:hypothetical protein